jgi:phosphatidylinositol alpha-mannosyltransferase
METTKPLKVGFVLDDSLDTPDGVQQYILTLGNWLKTQGHDVHYIVGQTKRTDMDGIHSIGRNVKVRFNQNRMSMPLPVSRKAIRTLLRREDFDVLHVQLPYSPFLAGRVIKEAPGNTAVVGTFHIAPHSRMVHTANHLLRVLTRRSLKRFDEIMSVSPVAQSFAKATFGIKSQIIPNTVELSSYMSATALPQYKAEQTIVFVGRLVERKGCQHLLRAIAYMQKHETFDHAYKVVICGFGPLEAQLKEYVRANNLESIVEFKGFIEEIDKPRYMASADIAVFPSTGGESFGIVLVEAMAAARGAVIAGNNPGYSSVMAKHPEALFDPKDEAGLASTIATLLRNPDKRKAAHAWQLSEVRQYGTSEVGNKVVAVYKAALHKRRG